MVLTEPRTEVAKPGYNCCVVQGLRIGSVRMLVTGKPFVRTFSDSLPDVEMKAKEQQETLDNLIRQSFINDSLSSFSKAGENSVQWVHWLDTMNQQSSNKGTKGLNLEVGLDAEDSRWEEVLGSDVKTGNGPGTKAFLHSSMTGSNMSGRGLQTFGDRLHSMKFPEAMLALAQAAAKGWPPLSNKVHMLKCEKCTREFYSPFNQRRHMRTTHRRHLKGDKEDSRKKKGQVAAFWEKLTPGEACEIVSSTNISLEDLSAASIVGALSTHLQQPGLPQSYIKAATALLEIVQNKPSRFPLHSQELLSILDDASEKNLLCGVTSSSMQRSIFDSEPGRVGLETKNLVASLGFLVELRLVKAWMADKDVEALRCQKELVEEEEAAQKKQAKLQERKRQKKMRQKESKDKERNSSLQLLNVDPFSRGNGTIHEEGDDSPTTSQSSSSSSSYSGKDTGFLMDFNDFEGLNSGKGQSSGLDDEPDKHSSDQDGQSPGSASSISNKNDLERPENLKHNGGHNESHSDAFGVNEDSCYGASQEVNSQTGFPVFRGDSGKPFRAADDKPSVEPKLGGGWGWRERRQGDLNDFSSHHKQPYGYDRRHYDYSYGGQRVLKKLVDMAGSSGSEILGTSGGCAVTPATRYGQYREKYSGIKRPPPNTGSSSHAVWARKAPQISSDSQQDERRKAGNAELVNETPLDMQLVHSNPASPEKFKALSQASSLAFDTVAAGVEEQANPEDSGVYVGVPTHVFSDAVSDMDAVSDISGGGEDTGSGALVIGSVTISLENVSSSCLMHTTVSSDSLDLATSLGKDGSYLEDAEDVCGFSGEDVTGMFPLVIADATLQVAMVSPLDVSNDASISARNVTDKQLGESPTSQNSSLDQLTRHSHRLYVSNKPEVPVWQPVTAVEHDDHVSGSSFETEIAEEQTSDIVSDAYREEGGKDHAIQAQQGVYNSSFADAGSSLHADNLQEDEQETAGSGSFEGAFRISHADYLDQQAEPQGGEFHASSLYVNIAHFLSHRWANAISASDSVDMQSI